MSSYGSCHGPLQVQASLWASCRLWWPRDRGHHRLDTGLSHLHVTASLEWPHLSFLIQPGPYPCGFGSQAEEPGTYHTPQWLQG